MKIFIGIPVYNRKEALVRLAYSLQEVEGIDRCEVHLFDDSSTEYDESFLKAILPFAVIHRNTSNLGADRNTFQIWNDFVISNADYLLICDSDMILHPECLEVIVETMPQTDGFLNIMNTAFHPTIREYDARLVEKKSVGSAGMVVTKSLANEIISSDCQPYILMWDWYVCLFLKEYRRRILACKHSYALHMGIDGENSDIMTFDYALGYRAFSKTDRQYYDWLHEQFVSRYMATSDGQKLWGIARKIGRERLRSMVSAVIGERRLLRLLLWRKKQRMKHVI